jgi:NADPH2:quinone reductase
MGSGVKSVSLPVLLRSIRSVFDAVGPAGLKIATTVVPLSKVEEVWNKATGKPRLVFSIG